MPPPVAASAERSEAPSGSSVWRPPVHTTITATWLGIPGAPGYSKFRFSGNLSSGEATAAAGRVSTMFSSIRGLLPATCSVNFAAVAQVFDFDSQLVSEVALDPPPTAVLGQAVGNYSGATGAVINWVTSTIAQGRRVRGRTFIVPLAAGFDTSGSLGATTITAIQGAAQTLAEGSPGLVIVKRPPGAVVGEYGVTGASVPDRAAILRSRRD